MNKKILLTRSKKDNFELRSLLLKKGFSVIEIPAISTKEVIPPNEKEILKNWQNYDSIAFTSKRSLFYFKKWLKKKGLSIKDKIFFGVGRKTCEKIKEWGINNVFSPEIEDGKHLSELILSFNPNNVLLVSPLKGNRDCEEILKNNGINVDLLTPYETIPKKLKKDDVEKLKEGIDIAFFASPSSARPFIENKEALEILSMAKLIPIGLTTFNFLKEKNLNVFPPPKNTSSQSVFYEICRLCDEK